MRRTQSTVPNLPVVPIALALAAALACTAEAPGPKKAAGTTDAGEASSGGSDAGPTPDAGAPSCEKLSESVNQTGCDAAPNCEPVSGALVEHSAELGFHTTDIGWTYGCATTPCDPYVGPICKEGTEPMPGTVGWLGVDGPACVPHGWVACPEVDVADCGYIVDECS